jgi:hypothetical protein
MLRKLRPRSVYDVLAVMGVFIALGGTTYAATGGSFVLGQGNSAGSTSSLTAPVAGSALQLTNPSTAGGASALGLTVGSGRPPFTTNSGTKVDNLNADRLDGHDSSYFLPVFGKAADANQLDGIDSSGLIQGQGRIETINRTTPASSTLLDLPGFALVEQTCRGTGADGTVTVQVDPNSNPVPVDVVADTGGTNPTHQHLSISGNEFAFFPTAASGDALTFSLNTGTKVATVFLFTYTFHNPVLNQDECTYEGHAIISDG